MMTMDNRTGPKNYVSSKKIRRLASLPGNLDKLGQGKKKATTPENKNSLPYADFKQPSCSFDPTDRAFKALWQPFLQADHYQWIVNGSNMEIQLSS